MCRNMSKRSGCSAMPCPLTVRSHRSIWAWCVPRSRMPGREEQKTEWLPRLAAGEIACFGLTEPGSGSDSAGLQTSAKRDGNGYVLNGSKRYITNAPHAKLGLIMARTNPDNQAKNAHISAFLVDMESDGITVGKPDKKMGQSGSHIADIYFDDVKVAGRCAAGRGRRARLRNRHAEPRQWAPVRRRRQLRLCQAHSRYRARNTRPSARRSANRSRISS